MGMCIVDTVQRSSDSWALVGHNSSRSHSNYFSEKLMLDISCESQAGQTVHMNC